MTISTLTTEDIQEIYESAVHEEATGSDEANFVLACKLDDGGGTGAVIRKLIDMVRARDVELLAVREAQSVPAAYRYRYNGKHLASAGCGDMVSSWKYCEESDLVNPDERYEHQALYTAPPAPAVSAELLDAMAEVIRISDRDHETWDRAKAAISACRAEMLEAQWNHKVCQWRKINEPGCQDYEVSPSYPAIISAPEVPGRPRLSPRMYADCVNMLQEVAIAFHGTGQLRGRLNSVLSQYVEPDHPHTRAAMLQPVSQGYTLPDGYKLVPVELLSTASMLIDLCRTHATLNGGGTYNQRVLSDCETTMNAIANLLAAAPTPTKAVPCGSDCATLNVDRKTYGKAFRVVESDDDQD
jgi:hypothetical protein